MCLVGIWVLVPSETRLVATSKTTYRYQVGNVVIKARDGSIVHARRGGIHEVTMWIGCGGEEERDSRCKPPPPLSRAKKRTWFFFRSHGSSRFQRPEEPETPMFQRLREPLPCQGSTSPPSPLQPTTLLFPLHDFHDTLTRHWGQGPKYPPGTCWIHWEYRQQVTPMCPVGKSWVY